MKTPPITAKAVIQWLGAGRFARLGEGRVEALEAMRVKAPNTPTAAIWTLQQCGIMPSEKDLERWSTAVAKLNPVNPVTPVNEA